MKKFSIYRYEHEHRKWEYGLALKFLLEMKSKTILDVGGGGSLLAPLLAEFGFEVTSLDIAHGDSAVEHQSKVIGKPIKFINANWLTYSENKKYDSIVCISVIEHIQYLEDTYKFFKKLLDYSNSLFMTTDFYPTRQTFSGNHWRTFNKDDMDIFVDIGKQNEFKLMEDANWEYKGNFVYEYTFASLALVKCTQ
jgi:hypothetical protein